MQTKQSNNASIKFTKVVFDIDDDLTHCTVYWQSNDPALCGHGARRSFAKKHSIEDITRSIHLGILVDHKWSILR